jgi:hypothetical protein
MRRRAVKRLVLQPFPPPRGFLFFRRFDQEVLIIIKPPYADQRFLGLRENMKFRQVLHIT